MPAGEIAGTTGVAVEQISTQTAAKIRDFHLIIPDWRLIKRNMDQFRQFELLMQTAWLGAEYFINKLYLSISLLSRFFTFSTAMSASERQPGPLFYSRAGKSCSQRLDALKLEAAVLRSESRKKVAPALPLMRALHKAEMSKEALDQVIVQEMKALKADMHAERERTLSLEKQSTTSPFKAKGRETQQPASLSPPSGHYKISYSQIDKKFPVPQLRRSRSTLLVNDISLPPGHYSPQYIRSKVRSPVPMHLQLERDSPQSTSPHEKRFEVLPRTPAISTKHRRSPVPDMSKGLPRVTFLVAPLQTPQYAANKEMLMSDLGRIMEFEKMSSRRSLFHLESSELEPYDVNYAQVLAKVPSPQLSKTLPKDRLPALPLPTFMQSAFSRFALQNINDQTIKMNCTRDSLLSPSPSLVQSLRLLKDIHK